GSHPANHIAIRDNDVYVLEFSGYGAISRNGEIIVRFDNPIEEFSGSIEPVMMLADEIIAFTLKDAKLLPVVYDLAGKRKAELPIYGFSALTASCHDERKGIFYSTSLGKPEIVHSYSSGKLEKVSENKLLDPEISEEFSMNDETKVHYFLASAKDSRHDRAVVYGYGGFNVSTTPGYRHIYAYLLAQGIDIVICNLRGGNEYGEEWHLQGAREKKINVFNDFKAVVKTIRDRRYRIVVDGASNGGLLTSYSLVNFPELLNGAVIGKPVIDMMRFHLLLAGNYWTNEYGNPDDESDRKFLSGYSPYSHVGNRVYPASLTWVRMNDDRVHPAHGLKFYARLLETGSPAYLRADFTGGHIGLKHESMLQESADIIAFVHSCFSS
ncbi:prolyl endopeptidase, partial [mine drainage metagenome]